MKQYIGIQGYTAGPIQVRSSTDSGTWFIDTASCIKLLNADKGSYKITLAGTPAQDGDINSVVTIGWIRNYAANLKDNNGQAVDLSQYATLSGLNDANGKINNINNILNVNYNGMNGSGGLIAEFTSLKTTVKSIDSDTSGFNVKLIEIQNSISSLQQDLNSYNPFADGAILIAGGA